MPYKIRASKNSRAFLQYLGAARRVVDRYCSAGEKNIFDAQIFVKKIKKGIDNPMQS